MALHCLDQAIELTQSQIEDMPIAASKMYGAFRRSFQAQMCLKYCHGSARKAERIWGWGRDHVQLGEEIPAPSTMATILNRMGYRLRKIVKAKPQKKFPKQMPSWKT